MFNIAAILLPLLSEGPSVLSDAEDVFSAVATGEGGAQKITNVLQSLAHLFTHASAAAAQVIPTPQPPPQTPAQEPAASAVGEAS